MDLHQQEDLAFQRNEWRVQRIAWIVMALIVLAALLGLFGGMGPVAETTARDSSDRFDVVYSRFARLQSPTKLQITVPEDVQQKARVVLSRGFLDSVRIESVSPEPEREELHVDSITYEFALGEQPAGGVITFHFTIRRAGVVTGTVEIETIGEVTFSTFTYP